MHSKYLHNIGLDRDHFEARVESDFFKTPDKIHIHYVIFRPLAGSARGTICLLQGRNENIHKYHETIQGFLAEGFTVATMDWRGQGYSEPRQRPDPRPDFRKYESDLEQFARIVAAHCPEPFYGVGHSMGGHMALRYAAAQREHCLWRKQVVIAPKISIPAAEGKNIRRILRVGAALPGIGNLSVDSGGDGIFETNQLTSDIEMFHHNRGILTRFPDQGAGHPTVRWVHASNVSRDWLRQRADQIAVPTLFVLPEQDRLVSSPAAEDFARRMTNAAVEIFKLPCLHEVLCAQKHLREEARARIIGFCQQDAAVPG